MTMALRTLQAVVSEREFQAAVVEVARLAGWRVHHCRPARTATGWRTPIEGDAGYPDLTLVRDGQLLFLELKTTRGRVRPEQDAWLSALRTVEGVGVEVVTPADWPLIHRRLAIPGEARRA